MKKTINFDDFCDSFVRMDRDNNFSYEGKKALFDHLTNCEEEMGIELELDVISLCSEFAEYASFEDIQKDYHNIETIEDLQDNTFVIEFCKGFIIISF